MKFLYFGEKYLATLIFEKALGIPSLSATILLLLMSEVCLMTTLHASAVFGTEEGYSYSHGPKVLFFSPSFVLTNKNVRFQGDDIRLYTYVYSPISCLLGVRK